jgi:hypothetical protein
VDFYIFLPLGKSRRFSFFGHAGVGYYFGFHGGLGMEMKLLSFVSLSVEFFGRYVNFKNWEGHGSYSWDEAYQYWYQWSGWQEHTYSDIETEYGSLWTYDIHDEDGNRDFTVMNLLEEEPDGSYIRNARKASVNLNSYGLSLSVQFHFDLF